MQFITYTSFCEHLRYGKGCIEAIFTAGIFHNEMPYQFDGMIAISTTPAFAAL